MKRKGELRAEGCASTMRDSYPSPQWRKRARKVCQKDVWSCQWGEIQISYYNHSGNLEFCHGDDAINLDLGLRHLPKWGWDARRQVWSFFAVLGRGPEHALVAVDVGDNDQRPRWWDKNRPPRNEPPLFVEVHLGGFKPGASKDTRNEVGERGAYIKLLSKRIRGTK